MKLLFAVTVLYAVSSASSGSAENVLKSNLRKTPVCNSSAPDLGAIARQSAFECASACQFNFCRVRTRGGAVPLPPSAGLLFPAAFAAMAPFICGVNAPAKPDVGRVLVVREAQVRISSGRFIRISRLGRKTLNPRFNPRFYSVRDLDEDDIQGVSAVSRSKFRSMDQRRVLEGRCTRLPIVTYEELSESGEVARLITRRSEDSCISFISTGTTTMIKVTLMWDTVVDLDLVLTEPNGAVIGFNSPTSLAGGFMFEDVKLGNCDINDGLRTSVEMVEYSGIAEPQTGTYTINVSQFGFCSSSQKTNWQLSVMVGGVTVLTQDGTIDGGVSDVTTATFSFP